jgi:8-oxo-dGTP pyrophosphatase MutT (NUDIX family)
MMHVRAPKDFNPKYEIVSCFLEHDGEILLLCRQDNRPQGNTWGVPAGKVDKGEKLHDATAREVREETGTHVHPKDLDYWGKVFVRYPDFDFVYHMFRIIMDKKPEIKINKSEHKAHAWISPKESLKLALMPDEGACVKLFYKLDD